jgi:site-specific recombinase XerD
MAFNTAHAETLALAEKYASYLSDEELEVFEEIVQRYRAIRHDIHNHVEEGIDRDIAIVKNYVAFTQLAPWDCEEDDFITWSGYLKNSRKIERSTLRLYHGSVRRFYEYFVSNTKFSKMIRNRFNITPSVICDRHLCIAHVSEFESSDKTNTDALSYDETTLLFTTLDDLINEASAYGGCKDLNPLMRDKALIYLTYVQGLRSHEALGLDTDSFLENPRRPQFGQYGRIKVKGKGHNGSGKKPRILPVTSIYLPVVMHTYINEVRPEFLSRADANDNALFMSERCTRLTYKSYWNRFNRLLDKAGLGGKGYALHTLRRTGLTHNAELTCLQTAQKLAGHAHASTTGLYLKRESNIVMQEIDAAIDMQIREALQWRKS